MQLELLEKFDLITNRKLIIRLNIAAIILFIAVLFFGSFFIAEGELIFDLRGIIIFFITYFIMMVCHEFIHGIFFKIFKPNAKIKYGFKNGMAYATNPGAIYTKKQYTTIIIMPFVIISIILYLLSFLSINHLFLFLLFAMHTAGCIGDFYYCLLLLKRRKEIFLEDTEIGFNIHTKKA